MTSVAVVGGGIAGLAAAWSLVHDHGVADVTVYEQSHVIGGALRAGSVAGRTVDVGAESMLARRPEAIELARQVGLGDDLVDPATTTARVLVGGSLRTMPEGTVLGIPTDIGAVGRSGILDAQALARLPLDHLLPMNPVEDDISVGDLVGRRLGPQVVERLVGPLLGAVYAGTAATLSLRACLPAVFAAMESERSLLAAARTVREASADTDTPMLIGVRGGVWRLANAVHEALAARGISVRTAARVEALTRRAEGWRLELGSTDSAEVDCVVLAVPAPQAADLLRQHSLGASIDLAQIEYASVATVSLGYDAARLAGPQPQNGDRFGNTSGFVVATTEPRAMKAATFVSKKWPWVRDQGSQVDLLRTSFGRYGDDALGALDDAELSALAQGELAGILRLGRDRAVDATVTRWPDALPQYLVGHVDRVESIREAVAGLPGLAVCGAAYDGIGIAATIGSARLAAATIAAPSALK